MLVKHESGWVFVKDHKMKICPTFGEPIIGLHSYVQQHGYKPNSSNGKEVWESPNGDRLFPRCYRNQTVIDVKFGEFTASVPERYQRYFKGWVPRVAPIQQDLTCMKYTWTSIATCHCLFKSCNAEVLKDASKNSTSLTRLYVC